MKISIDGGIFLSQRVGGVSRYVAELVKLLSKRHEVKVSGAISQNLYLNESQNLKDLFSGQTLNSGLTRYHKYALKAPNQLYTAYQILSGGFELHHQTYYSIIPQNLNANTKSILTVYDMIHEIYPNYLRDAKITQYAKRKSINRADKIIAISESTRNDLIEMYKLDPLKVQTVHLGASTAVEQDKYCHPKPYILYVGARSGYKNFMFLLEAIKNIGRKFDYDIICFGGGAFTAEEKTLIATMNDKIEFIQVNGTDKKLSQLYNGCDFFTFPSLYEGFGLPPLEALAHGKLPLVCDSSSLPEVVGDHGLYFEANRIESLMHALVDAMSAPKLRTSTRSLKAHLAKFSWQRCAKNTEAVYLDY